MRSSCFYIGKIRTSQMIMGSKRKNRLSFVIKKSSKFAILIASKSISSRFTNYCFTSAGFNLIHSMYISN